MKNFIPLSRFLKPIFILLVVFALYVNEFNFSNFEKIVIFMLALIYFEVKEM